RVPVTTKFPRLVAPAGTGTTARPAGLFGVCVPVMTALPFRTMVLAAWTSPWVTEPELWMLWLVLAMTALALAAQGTAGTAPELAGPEAANAVKAVNNERINERFNMIFLRCATIRCAPRSHCTRGAARRPRPHGGSRAEEADYGHLAVAEWPFSSSDSLTRRR